MSRRRIVEHADWLLLMDPDGPFFTADVVAETFPSGLERTDPQVRAEVRQRWADAREADDRTEFVEWILATALRWEPRISRGDEVPSDLVHVVAEHSEELRPTLVLAGATDADRPRVLVEVYPTGTRLDARLAGRSWPASPVQRMALLCRSLDVPIGLVTDGELFTLVWAPRNGATGRGTWRSSLFSSEPAHLDSFLTLLHLGRFFSVGDEQTPEAMLADSADNQADITDTLGNQARRAVELLVNAISRGNLEQGGRLLDGVGPHEVYEAAVTVLMRLVILLTAEERGLLPADDAMYANMYAISTLKAELEEAEHLLAAELELRSSAWHRVLAVSRAVHGGIDHPDLRVPAYGSRLFDPDRFPFLEGRRPGEATGRPLPVADLSMLGILRALQELSIRGELRKLSYRHLEVEQIGHVYEGLLDHDAIVADEVVVGMIGKKGLEPEIPLAALEEARLDGQAALIDFLVESTKSTQRQVEKLLDAEPDDVLRRNLRVACDNDDGLVGRLMPFAQLLRVDLRGVPLVFPPGSVYVTETSRKRDSGTAYTTRELADEVARYALEPLVYEPGPAETADRAEWRLKSSAEILDLKVCDPAVGSGAILVGACRYLADRLVEAWIVEGLIEDRSATADDDPSRLDVVIDARRAVAERCLYGVDRDAMAVEMAKLGLWLVTMSRERPFSFLDHAIVRGDSLIGINTIDQLEAFCLDPTIGRQTHSSALLGDIAKIRDLVVESAEIRAALETRPVATVQDAADKESLLERATSVAGDLFLMADLVTGASVSSAGDQLAAARRLSGVLDLVVRVIDHGDAEARAQLQRTADEWLTGQVGRKCGHWPLMFPEVFAASRHCGFDAFVGNPPYIGNKYWKERLGPWFQRYFESLMGTKLGKPDLMVVFLWRLVQLCRADSAMIGTLSTQSISEVDSKKLMVKSVLTDSELVRVVSSREWPGAQSVTVAQLWIRLGQWAGPRILDGVSVLAIGPDLRSDSGGDPEPLKDAMFAFQGVDNSKGLAFVVPSSHPLTRYRDLFKPYVSGEDFTQRDYRNLERYVLDLTGWSEGDLAGLPTDVAEFLELVVRPERNTETLSSYKGLDERWWTFWNTRENGFSHLRQHSDCVAISAVAKYLVPMRLSSHYVFTNKAVVVALDRPDVHTLLLSPLFDAWSKVYGGSMDARRVMKVKPVLGTFPTPSRSADGQLGFDWQEACTAALHDHGPGMTDVLNAVHNPACDASIVEEVRALYTSIHHSVLAAYGWGDVDGELGFHPVGEVIRWGVSESMNQTLLSRALDLNRQLAASSDGKPVRGRQAAKQKDALW